jgi:division protein CdvB (Snf7/Vps24/ESCRT-III family)
VDLSDTQWYKEFIKGIGENRVLMIAHGVVKAGIDLREIKQEDIIVTDRKIIIKLPPSRVTDAYLDDKLTKVVEYKTGLLRSFDKNLEQDARQQAVLDINRAAREAGILKDADERAKSQLKDLFTKMGYEVEFR